jgi:5-methylcytosine-specific restriction enzyme subunit McrC
MLPWRKVQIDRASHRWRSLLDLARLLLGSRWQQTHADARAPEGITLLFPMNDLFERYIAIQLRQALMGKEVDVVAQGGFAYCLGPWRQGEDCVVGNSHPTRPDILVKHDGRVVAVIDTKWKRLAKGVSHADVYQMMAYARLYSCPHLVLLYPSMPGEDAIDVETRGIAKGPDRLDLATVSLEHGPRHVQSQLSELIKIPSSIEVRCPSL